MNADHPDRRQERYSQLIADGADEDEAHDIAQAESAMNDHDQIDTTGETQ